MALKTLSYSLASKLTYLGSRNNAVPSDTYFNNVSLLIHANSGNGGTNNTFLDSSPNNFTITRNGTPTQGTYTPFNLSGAYSASSRGGSIYFNGSTDYITSPSDTSTTLSGDFTIEYWVNRAVTGNNYIFTLGDSFQSTGIETYIGTSGTNLILYSGNANRITSASLPAVSTWAHIAVVRSGTTITMYLNGTSVGTWTSSATFSGICYIGAEFYNGSITGRCNGYISNFRIVKGTALYTSGFSPSTTPLTSITNTSLLLSATNGSIIDNSGKNNIITVSTAQVSTAQAKFGTSSMLFNGTSDYLTIPSNTIFDFGSGDFTIEGWVYPTTIAAGIGAIIRRGVFGVSAAPFNIIRNGSALQLYVSSDSSTWNIANGTNIGSVSANTWSHFAVSRNGSTFYTFLNGVAGSTATSAAAVMSTTSDIYIGSSKTSEFFTGYIDELRITKGTSRYISGFTPATAAFQDQ